MKETDAKETKICPMTLSNKKPGRCLGSGCCCWVANTKFNGYCSLGKQTRDGYSYDTSPGNQGN